MRRLAAVGILLALLLPPTRFAHADSDAASEQEAERLAALVLDRMLAEHARVIAVADQIRISAAPYCGGEVGAVLGIFVANEKTFLEIVPRDLAYEERVQRSATARFALDARPRVLIAPPGLPAAEAGIQVGDVIVELDGRALGRRDRLYALRVREVKEPLRVTVERAGQRLTLAVPARMGCAFPAQSWFGASINAFATRFGSYTGTYVLYGMLDFLPSDDDLAVILGHELSHLILDNGGTRRTEAEADYLGLYLAARAGYDVTGASAVWARLGRANPFSTIDWGYYAHPSSPARMLELEATVAEIAKKRTSESELEAPELKTVLDRPVVDPAATADATTRLRAEALADLQAMRERLLRVSYALRTRGTALCGGETGPILGAAIGRRRDVLAGKQAEAKEIFGLVDEPQVLAVVPGSPAAEAGLAPGDLLLRVNGESVAKTQAAFAALRARRESGPVITIARAGAEIDVTLPLVVGCRHEAMLVMSGSFYTSTDPNGEELRVPLGLLRFARSDDELAFALAHQLAHHLHDSTHAGRGVDEPNTDELALRLMSSAGFDPLQASPLLERMVEYDPREIHEESEEQGSIAERLLAMRKEHSVIDESEPSAN